MDSSTDNWGSVLKRYWKLLVLAIAIVFLYGRILADLASDWWTDPNYSHGLVLPIVIGYLIWHQKEKLAALPIAPSNLGLLVMLAGIATLFLGDLGAEFFLSRISLLILLAGLIVFLWGMKHLRILAFPMALFVLAIPLPAIIFYQITFPLQLLASSLGSTFLQVFHVPVLQQGNVIVLPNITLEVAEACSGIRSLFSLATLAVLYSYFLEDAPWLRVTLVALSIPLALFCNGLRIMGTGILTQYINPEAAEGFFHAFSGWFIFLTALISMFIVHRGLLWFKKA